MPDEEKQAYRDRASRYNEDHGLEGYPGADNQALHENMAREAFRVLFEDQQKIKKVCGLDSFTLFGSQKLRNPHFKATIIGTGKCSIENSCNFVLIPCCRPWA